jgi:hypothetical protein
MPSRFHLTIVLLAGMLSPAALFGSGLKPESRMAIIRGLTAEYASLKVPLPRGKKGLLLSSDGKVDEQSLKREIVQNGTAFSQNILVQITEVDIEAKAIIFEINGGGKKKTKWYDHVEVGVGNNTQPISQNTQTPTGSAITLQFPQKIEDLSVEELKNYLSPVLNFNPTTSFQMPSRPVAPEFQKAIEEKKAVVGMDRDMVTAALGPPLRKVREDKDGVEQEDWIYGTPPMKITFVTFEGEEVIDVHDYTGGIGGAVQPAEEAPR